jgi:hypothetical protein
MDEQPDLLSGDHAGDPYPVYDALRRDHPVYQEPQLGTWVLTRYDDVYGALRDHATFSSAEGVTPGERGLAGDRRLPLMEEDPPRHTLVRQAVHRTFAPRRIGRFEPRVREIAVALLDATGDEFDAIEALAVPLPVTVIAHLLGIAPEDRARFKYWSDAVTGLLDVGDAEDGEERAQRVSEERALATAEMVQYFATEIGARRDAPADDLISAVVTAEVEGELFTDEQALMFCGLFLVAGNETTTNLISNMLNVLVERPDLWAALRADRTLSEPVVEETLRFESPVQMLWRTTTRPVTLHGVTIPPGEKVALCFAAANRDPDGFAAPDEFRLDRELGQHLAFGYGTHYCMGSPLARLEAQVALDELLTRYERLERGGGPAERLPSPLLRGFARLPIRGVPALT